MTHRFRLPPLAGVVALVFLLTACGGSARNVGSPSPFATATADNAAKTEASDVRARLTALLRAQTNLTAFTTQTAQRHGFGSTEMDAAVEALHHNGEDLTRLIEEVHGFSDSERGASEIHRFGSHWGDRIEYLRVYIQGALPVAADESLKSEAESKLIEVDTKLGEVMADVTEDAVSPEEASGLLTAHTSRMTATIDAIARRERTAPLQILETARGMDGIAKSLSRGFAVDRAEVAGEATGEAATLRAELTGILLQHAAQTIVLAHVAAVAGPASDRTAAAVEALRATREELVHRIEKVYGKKTAEELGKLYEEHVSALVAYVKARADGTAAGATESPGAEPTGTPTEAAAKLPSKLRDWPRKFADFAARITNGHLAREKFQRAITEQLRALRVAVDAVVTTGLAAAEEVERAESRSFTPAKLLAAATVERFPDKFE